MTITKVYIGGPTQAGKSTLAKHVSWKTGLLLKELDTDYFIRLARRKLKYKHRQTPQRWRTIQLLRARRSAFVAEGIYLTPASVNKHLSDNESVLAVFIGYPEVSVTDKKQLIRSNNYRDGIYLQKLSDDAFNQRIQNGISKSREQRSQCQVLGIPYFDFSDASQLQQNQEMVSTWVQHRIQQG